MLKGFKEFLARGNIIDLVCSGRHRYRVHRSGHQVHAKVSFSRWSTGSVPAESPDVGILKIDIGGGQFVDFNVALSAAINFIIIAAVVYFLVVLPYNTLRKRGEVKQAEDTELSLLTQIRDQLAESGGGSSGHHSANAPESPTIEDR